MRSNSELHDCFLRRGVQGYLRCKLIYLVNANSLLAPDGMRHAHLRCAMYAGSRSRFSVPAVRAVRLLTTTDAAAAG